MPSTEGIKLLNEEKIEFIVKSPGIPWKAELLKVAKENAYDIGSVFERYIRN